MVLFTSNWLVLLPIAISLFVAMRLAQGSADQGRDSWFVLVLRSLIALLLLFAMLSFGLRGNIVSTVWIGLVIVFGFVLFWKSRRLERAAVLQAILSASGPEQQVFVLTHLRAENQGWVHRVAGRLRRDLGLGLRLDHALERQGVALGVYEKIAVRLRAAYGIDARSQGGKSNIEAAIAPHEVEAEGERLLGRLVIFSWTIVIAPIIALIMTFIVPTFKEMFEEFGLQLPAATRVMIATGDFSTRFGLVYLFALLPLVLSVAVVLLFSVWLFPSLLKLPLFRWACRDYHRTAGFHALTYTLDREATLPNALRAAAELVPISHVSERFSVTAGYLDDGMSLGDALLKTGLLSKKEREALGSGIDRHNPTWGLRQLSSWKTQRMLERYSIIVQIAIVVVTLLIAVVVGTVALGLLSALIEMILNLA